MGEFPLCSVTRRETRLCDLAARGFRHGLLGDLRHPITMVTKGSHEGVAVTGALE
jgi:hypothetical protein